jgi:AcrR family transcriptional regulator
MGADDGRRRRREANRDAVVGALLDLIRDGDLDPGAEDVAARAGLSARSVFRYFDDLDDLCRAAIARQHEDVDDVLAPPALDGSSLQERVQATVEQRVRLFEAMGNVGTVARLRAPFQPLVAEQLRQVRRLLRDRMADALEPGLTGLDPATAGPLLAAADVLCSFEAYHLFRDDQRRSRAATVEAMVTGVRALLASAGVAAR